MKQNILTLLLLLGAMTVSAQLKVSSNGKVTVGSTNPPASTLSVNCVGDSTYTAYINGKMKIANGYLNGRLKATTAAEPDSIVGRTPHSLSSIPYYMASDKKLTAIKMLRQLHPVYYENPDMVPEQGHGFNNNNYVSTIHAHYGIPVSDFQTAFPEMVTEDENGNLVVDYTELIAVMVQAINSCLTSIEIPSSWHLNALAGSDGEENAAEEEQEQPGASRMAASLTEACLYQNTPNPFSSQTVIRFRLPADAPSSYIYIFDMTGKMLRQIPVDSDMQSITINGYELEAGLYLYSLVVGGMEIDTKRMILSK